MSENNKKRGEAMLVCTECGKVCEAVMHGRFPAGYVIDEKNGVSGCCKAKISKSEDFYDNSKCNVCGGSAFIEATVHLFSYRLDGLDPIVGHTHIPIEKNRPVKICRVCGNMQADVSNFQ